MFRYSFETSSFFILLNFLRSIRLYMYYYKITLPTHERVSNDTDTILQRHCTDDSLKLSVRSRRNTQNESKKEKKKHISNGYPRIMLSTSKFTLQE